MSTESIRDSLAENAELEAINEWIAEHKMLALFIGLEIFFIVSGYLFGMVTIRIEEQGPALSDIIAGLLGGLAVVWVLIGAVTYGVLLLSNLYMRYQREM